MGGWVSERGGEEARGRGGGQRSAAAGFSVRARERERERPSARYALRITPPAHPAGSRTTRPPCAQRPAQRQSAQRPRCSGPVCGGVRGRGVGEGSGGGEWGREREATAGRRQRTHGHVTHTLPLPHFGPVVAGAGLAEHKVVGAEDLAVRPSAHSVHGAGLQVEQHGAGDVPPCTAAAGQCVWVGGEGEAGQGGRGGVGGQPGPSQHTSVKPCEQGS